ATPRERMPAPRPTVTDPRGNRPEGRGPEFVSSTDRERTSLMAPLRVRTTMLALLGMVGIMSRLPAAEPVVDLSGYRTECGVIVRHEASELRVQWPIGPNQDGHLVFDLRRGEPLFRAMGITPRDVGSRQPLFEGMDPATFLLVGTRQAPGYRPPEMSIFN